MGMVVWFSSVATPTEVAMRVGDPRGYKSQGALYPWLGWRCVRPCIWRTDGNYRLSPLFSVPGATTH
jgi:hypothetical protein